MTPLHEALMSARRTLAPSHPAIEHIDRALRLIDAETSPEVALETAAKVIAKASDVLGCGVGGDGHPFGDDDPLGEIECALDALDTAIETLREVR